MYSLLNINWNPNPELFNLFGISIRYYGLLWAVGIFFAYVVVHYQFRDKKIEEKKFDPLFFYCFFGILIGARLGHCLFYDPGYYLSHFWEMVLPIKFMPDGNWKFTGYEGLASHGAAIGIIAGLWYYSRKVSKKSIFWILDRAVIPIALAGFFIRTGNLMNSEIVGLPTNMPWGFRFMNSDLPNPELPRHPAQLYEAICYLFSFFVLMYLYWRTNVKKKMGFIFGAFLILIFSARFIIEFVKEVQEPWEAGMALNMGQILSIPFILAGIFMLWYSKKLPDEGEKKGKKGKG